MTTSISLTDEVLGKAIERMEQAFDSHAVIRDLMRNWPRAYANDLYATAGNDPIQTLHAGIGKRLSSFDIIEKTHKGKGMNVRGEEETENQWWRKK